MPADRSRGRDDRGLRYKAILMQQGRVLLDRDFNAQQELTDDRIGADAFNEIGACGTPDNGFAITLPPGATAVPVTRSYSGPNPLDFVIGPGTMYVGGQHVVLPPPDDPKQPWSYFNQPDWLCPDQPATLGRSHSVPYLEYIYLRVFEQEVGAVEDPDLLDVALGGPDTTQRIRLMWRVERTPILSTDCASALAEAAKNWAGQGLQLDPNSLSLRPAVRLQVSFTQATTTTNPCDPTVQGGYLGAENQLLRLQIGPPVNGQAQLLWGYDNASFLYRVSVQGDAQTLLLAQTPVDAFHCPQAGQVVEILRPTAKLGLVPGATSSTPVVRYAAEAIGLTAQVKSYNSSNNSVLLSAALPKLYTTDPNAQYFLRVWQGQQALDPSQASNTIVLKDPTLQTAPGVQVTVTTASSSGGGPLPFGAYWVIALRPNTPQAVYPERFLYAPQPPDGPRQWICPLAILDWQETQGSHSYSRPAYSRQHPGVLCDCRLPFLNLVELTQRKLSGCCTLSVTPADARDLQSRIDSAVTLGPAVRVCFAPGTYSLFQPLRLGAAHSGLVLEACQGETILQAHPDANLNRFLDGLIILVGADDVELRGFHFQLPPVPLAAGLEGRLNPDIVKLLLLFYPNTASMIGVRLVQSQQVTIDGCTLLYAPPAQLSAIGFGILRTGDCRGMIVQNSRFVSTTPSTFTKPAPATTTAPTPAMSLLAPRAAPAATPTALPLALPTTVALFGVVAFRTLGLESATSQPNVDNAWLALAFEDVLQGNRFTNLTLALTGSMRIASIEIRENVVTDSFGGFWLETDGGPNPSDPNDSQYGQQFLGARNQVNTPVEVNAYELLTFALPLPLGFDHATYQDLRATNPFPPRTSLTIADNRIETLMKSGTALFVVSIPPNVEGRDRTASLFVTGNDIRGTSFNELVPLVLLSYDGTPEGRGSAIVSGNTIFAYNGAPALDIYPNGGVKAVHRLSVTGNVVRGRTNIGQLVRGDPGPPPSPLNTWLYFNAVSSS